MKITVSLDKFDKEWKPTGHMIKDGSSYVQTYEHNRFEGRFVQKKSFNPLFGTLIDLISV